MGGSWLRPTPKQFGNYSILDHIATGGMAEVYLARQGGMQGFEKIVVIKRAKPELMADHELTKAFLDEARLVATLQHPNIAQVYEIGMEEDSYFFVMEYVQGVDLRQLMQRAVEVGRKISIADAVYIAIQICIALHYAHEKRDRSGQPLAIVHRDVTPSNVLLSHDGAVKVCDFGIARSTNRTTETVRGAIKGKWSYMSPEQCRCEPLDRRSDVFAIGILLYEMATLSQLFTGDSDFEILQKIVQMEIPRPTTRVPFFPKDLERIVMKALAKDRAARQTTAQALQLELEEFARNFRLALSPVNITRLIGDLFDENITSWVKDRNAAKAAQLRDALAQPADAEPPQFLPIGTDTPPSGPPAMLDDTTDPVDHYDVDTDLAIPKHRQPPEPATNPILAPLLDAEPVIPPAKSPSIPPQKTLLYPEPVARPPTAEPVPRAIAAPARRPSGVWIAGAVIAGAVAVGVSIMGHRVQADSRAAAAAKLDGDAQRIATQIEQVMQSTQLRAKAIATAPIIRAAIETDVATMRDVVDKEYKLSLGAHETLEMFQVRDNAATTLLRLPADAPALRPQVGASARLEARGRDALGVVIGEPIARQQSKDVVGEVELAAPVDLADAQPALSEHTAAAKLAGLGVEIALVAGDGDGAAPERIALRAIGDVPAGALVLVATPQVERVGWVGPATYIAACLAVLLLMTYAMAWWLSRAPDDEQR
jgi:eukaryotic-like serine/threonine-protein kinase